MDRQARGLEWRGVVAAFGLAAMALAGSAHAHTVERVLTFSTGTIKDSLSGVAVDGEGNIIVAKRSAIDVYTGGGDFLNTFGTFGTGAGEFRGPGGVTVDESNNIIVSDTLNHRIQVFESDGTFLFAFGSEGSGDGQFAGLRGVAVTGSGDIVVADGGNRIQVFRWFMTAFACEGFEAPMDREVLVRGRNRVLPLRMELFDEDSYAVTDYDIESPPVVQVDFVGSGSGEGAEEYLDSAGRGDDGNQFSFDDGKWGFNLRTRSFTAEGQYEITALSGDPAEYLIADPTCKATFFIQ